MGYILASKIAINEEMYQIVKCESGWNNSARGKAGEIGLAQFKPETWKWMSKLAGINGDINNQEDQLKLLKWALDNNYSNHWTCWRKLYVK